MPTTLNEAVSFSKGQNPLIVSGATDIGVQVNKGKRELGHILSLINCPESMEIKREGHFLKIGARVTLEILEKSMARDYPEYARLLHVFASPQIKNAGTLVGNVVNASPIADGVPFLLLIGATVETISTEGKRTIALDDFYIGYKKTRLKKNELIYALSLPLDQQDTYIKLYKVSLRKDLDISAVTMATRLKIEHGLISDWRLVLGGVGATIIRLNEIEKLSKGRTFDLKLIEEVTAGLPQWIAPLSDVRGSKEYRLQLCKNLLHKFYDEWKSEAGTQSFYQVSL